MIKNWTSSQRSGRDLRSNRRCMPSCNKQKVGTHLPLMCSVVVDEEREREREGMKKKEERIERKRKNKQRDDVSCIPMPAALAIRGEEEKMKEGGNDYPKKEII